MIIGLQHSHSGLAYLFVFSTGISMLLSWMTFMVGPKPVFLKVGAVLARVVETSIGGLMAILGILLCFMLNVPLSTAYIWIGLAVVIASGGMIARGIKPSILGLAAQDDRALRLQWVMFATAHFGLVALAMVSMLYRWGQA